MKHSLINSNSIKESLRLDCKFYIERGSELFDSVFNNHKTIRLGELLGDEHVWIPPRFSQVECTDSAHGKPYISPWNTLRYIPRIYSYLSCAHNKDYGSCEVNRGWLLVTCSGRNLGPSIMVDETLASFIVSGDMIRISAPLSDELFYVMAYLHTSIGQYAIRRNRSGSVIDHINPKIVRELPIPVIQEPIAKEIAAAFQKGFLLREKARSTLLKSETDFSDLVGLRVDAKYQAGIRRFVTNRSALCNRIDAEPYSPTYSYYRKLISDLGCGVRISDIALVSRPPGRYKTIYVKDENYGTPMLSGRHMAQFRPVALKVISPMSFKDVNNYLLTSSTVLLTCDGRAEDNLGDCVMIAQDRAGWLASSHIMRLEALPDINAGLLYLACTCNAVQAQLKSLSTGSVVDALNENDIGSVVVPYPKNSEAAFELGRRVVDSWQEFAEAKRIEDSAIEEFQNVLLHGR